MPELAEADDCPIRLLHSVTPMKSPQTWPAVFPSIAALLLIDILASIWIYFNAPAWRPLLSFGNVLIVGYSTILGLLPKDASKELGARAQSATLRILGHRLTRAALIGVIVVLVIASASEVALLVQGDWNGAAHLHVVDGPQSHTRPRRVELETLAVSRATPSVEMHRFSWPTGRTVWGYTATHVTKRDGLLLPWRPVKWSYPEDFDEMVTLYVLPMTSADLALRVEKPTLVVSDGDSLELLHIALEPRGIKAGFFISDEGTDSDTTALAAVWSAMYGKADARDTAAIARRVRLWMHADTLRPRRPLHLHERVFYEIRFQKKQRRGPFVLDLVRNPLSILLDSTAVERPSGQSP